MLALDGRRGRAPDARDRRGVVLEPLARAAVAQGRDVGQHARGRGAARRLRRRRAPPARDARPGRRVTPARVSCFAPALWRTIAAARARAAGRLVHDGAARRRRRRVRAQGRRGGGRADGRRARRDATSASSRRRPTSSTTCTSCSPRAASTSPRRGRAADARSASTSLSRTSAVSSREGDADRARRPGRRRAHVLNERHVVVVSCVDNGRRNVALVPSFRRARIHWCSAVQASSCDSGPQSWRSWKRHGKSDPRDASGPRSTPRGRARGGPPTQSRPRRGRGRRPRLPPTDHDSNLSPG